MGKYFDFRGRKLKHIILHFISAGIISALIGFVFLILSCPGCISKLSSVVQNVGYSLFLGYGLFAFGFVFGWLETRYVFWIKHTVKSLLIVLGFSAMYSSLVIFGVNYIWHSVIGGIPFAYLIKHHGSIMWIEFGIFYFIALWFYARSFFFEWRLEVENKEKLKREALQLQYESLKTQVNPHFLFNSLNALNTLIDIDVESAKVFTRELSRFYRDILELKGKELIKLKEELNILDRYMYLQQVRFGSKFSFTVVNQNQDHAMVIPLSVQMLVENVFNHNVISSDNIISINLNISESELSLSNTYVPIKKEVESTGLGLKNLKDRIHYLTGKELIYSVNKECYKVVLPLIFIKDEDITG